MSKNWTSINETSIGFPGHIMTYHCSIILFQRCGRIIQRRQGVRLDVPDSGCGMAEAVPDIEDVLPPQFQEAGTYQGRRNILPTDTDRFLRRAGSFRHQLHIAAKDVGVTGMVPD